MTGFVFSISMLCLAAMNNEQLCLTPQELLSARFQEQFSGKFERIRKILLQESRYQRTVLRKVIDQPFRYAAAPSLERAEQLRTPPPTISLSRLLIVSSRPIRAPAA